MNTLLILTLVVLALALLPKALEVVFYLTWGLALALWYTLKFIVCLPSVLLGGVASVLRFK